MLACQPCVHPYYLPITLFESPCVPRRQAKALVSDIRVTGIRRTEALECMSPSPLPSLSVFHFRPFIPLRCQHFVILSPFLSPPKSDSVISLVHRVPSPNMHLALDSEWEKSRFGPTGKTKMSLISRVFLLDKKEILMFYMELDEIYPFMSLSRIHLLLQGVYGTSKFCM